MRKVVRSGAGNVVNHDGFRFFNHYHHYHMNLKFLSLIKAVIAEFPPDSPAPIHTRLGSFMA